LVNGASRRQEAIVSRGSSGQLIPFPVPAIHHPGQKRLNAAIAELSAALAAQHRAAAAWGDALDQLRAELTWLSKAAAGYGERLGELSLGIGRLHQQARRLERWADTLTELE
jgi:hypothetical protein